MKNKDKGLLPKYIITKADGSPVDPRAEYFVLRVDKHAADQIHAEACRRAIVRYAIEVQSHLPVLSKELRLKYEDAAERVDRIQAETAAANKIDHEAAHERAGFPENR